ncbi:MAG: PSD1 domain-containing protein [Bryobacterales bacterium]|nr:PSD1 domain-containing protein [Bryobacterales bacterium]
MFLSGVLSALLLPSVFAQAPGSESLAFFESKVRPVLAEHCYSCHSAKAKTPFAGLNVDSRGGLLRGGDRGPAVVPGKPDDSLLIQALRHRVVQMPPGRKLDEAQVAALEAWVRMGAPWPEEKAMEAGPVKADPVAGARHWAWQPLRVATGRSIDAFVAEGLARQGLKASPEADKRTLLRRLSYDLTGMPPTYEEIEAFVADKDPQAWEKAVDRLLASPHFGERWARYWLDLARYSDAGFNNVRFPYAFAYRDWLIAAFNQDMPYNLFVERQLAADHRKETEHLAALGLLSLGQNPPRATLIPDKVDDRIDVVSRTFLGLTVACARCHDHKYDPIPTRDYYSLYGVFVNSQEPELPAVVDSSATPLDGFYLPRLEQRMAAIRAYKQRRTEEIRAELRQPEMLKKYLRATFDTRTFTAPQADSLAKERTLNTYVLKRWRAFLVTEDGRQFVAEATRDLDAALEAWAQRAPKEPTEIPYEDFGMVLTEGDGNTVNNLRWAWDRIYADYAFRTGAKRAMAVTDAPQLEQAHVFVRGNMNDVGDPVPRRFVSLLSKAGGEFRQGSGRLELAQAIVDKSNPMTARVWANRVWQHLFGEGLVRTPSDFGIRGEAPSHPELLDELAQSLLADGWSTKKLVRRIVLSKTYRQTSGEQPAARLQDPENRLLWRMNRRRLDFDAVRDTLLAASGQLKREVGGPSFSLNAVPAEPRRTLYAYAERERAQMLLKSFDYADPEQHTPQRHLTTVPQQALFFLNSAFLGEQARHLSRRADLRGGRYDEAGIGRLYRYVLGRVPTAREVEVGLAFLKDRDANSAPPEGEAQRAAWYYGYGTLDADAGKVTRFVPFRFFNDDRWQAASLLPDREAGSASLTAGGGTPGDDSKRAVIRRWLAPLAGKVEVKGKLSQGFGPYEQRFHLSNGIRGWVVSSRQGVLGKWVIDPITKTEKFTPNETATVETNLEIEVQAGEFLDFVVDSRDDYESDEFNWAPQISLNGQAWDARKDFAGPRQRPLTPWQEYAQVLLLTNEAVFVD